MATKETLFKIFDGMRSPLSWYNTGMLGHTLSMLPSYRGQRSVVVLSGRDEEIMAEIGHTTAFASATNIFFTEKFLEKLTDAGTLFVLLHEAAHICYGHGRRRGSRNPKKWNIACDFLINGHLMYTIMPAIIGKPIAATDMFTGRPIGVGMTPSSESQMRDFISREMIEEDIHYFLEEEEKQGRLTEYQEASEDGEGNEAGGGGGGGGSGGGGPGKGSGKGKGKQKTGDTDLRERHLDDHSVNGAELRKQLEKQGPEGKDLADRMGLPETNEEEEKIQKDTENIIRNTLARTASDNSPGGRINSYMKGMIKKKDGISPLSWKITLGEAIKGSVEGEMYRNKRQQDRLSQLSMIPSMREKMGLSRRIHIPALTPKSNTPNILVILDTSGSVSEDEMSLYLREIYSLAKEAGEASITIVTSDTDVRTKVKFNTSDAEQMNNILFGGGGGTDMLAPLVQCVADNEDEPYDIAIIMSDGGFPPFTHENIIDGLLDNMAQEKVNEIPQVAFVITREHYSNDEFTEALNSFPTGTAIAVLVEEFIATNTENGMRVSEVSAQNDGMSL